jgi:Tol biopolymer transport system component
LPWLVAAVAIGVAAFALRSEPPVDSAAARVTRLTNLRGLEEAPAISPDGRFVTYTSGEGNRRELFVQLIAGGAPLPVTRSQMDHQSPRWTPDSSTILYFSPAAAGERQGNIWEVPALGGAPRRVIDSLGGTDVGPDGRLALFRLADEGIQLVTASSDASSVEVVANFQQATYYLYPRWSPDGRWIAFQRGDSIRFDIFVVSATGGEPRQLTFDNTMMSGFAWLPDSSGIIYSSSRGVTMPYLPTMILWRVVLSDGAVQQVTSNEASYQQPDIARNGTMVAARVALESDIWRFPTDGPPAENVRRAIRVTRQTGQVLTPTAGPGDREIAFLSDRGGHANLWVVDTKSGELRQVTHERDPNVAVGVPVWSPDGRSITFVYSRGNKGLTWGVWLVDPDGSNLRSVANPGLGPAWSNDGRWLYYSTRGSSSVDVVLRKMPADGGQSTVVTTEQLRNVIGSDGSTLYYLFERPLVDGAPEFEIRAATPENAPFRVLATIPASRVPIWQIVNPALSPDGTSLAQALTDGLTTNIWTLSTTTAGWRQITDFEDRPTFIARRVSWSSDGESIFAAVGEGESDIVLLDGILDQRSK